MELALGFFIALAIGLTGIGGGTLTAPVLMLLLQVPAATAVGTALAFGAVVKLAAAPVYLLRSRVSFRLLGYMLAGGVPGVSLGAWILSRFDARDLTGAVLTIVGLTVVLSASMNLIRLRKQPDAIQRDRARVLPWLAFPIGMQVGFSSAGAGSLGTLALLQFSSIAPVRVVGTDLLFGLVVAAIGGGLHLGLGGVDTAIALRLIAGGIPGVLLGAHLAGVTPARKLKYVLSLWLVYLGSQLLYRGLGSFFSGG